MPAGNPLTDWSDLRRLLVKRRIDLGLTQGAAAARIGVGVRTLNRWETRNAEPKALELFRWCSAMGVKLLPEVASPSDAMASTEEAAS